MANLASGVWQDESVALILALHSERAPSDAEWDRFCSWIPQALLHPNPICMVLTDGGTPSSAQRDQLRRVMASASGWTAVVTDKAVVRGVVTAVRWFNPQVCAFAPWEIPEIFTYLGLSGGQIPSVCARFAALDLELSMRSRVLAEFLRQLRSQAS